VTADLATWNAFVRRPEWFDDAACRAIGVQAFFDSRREKAEARAVAICADCPVRLDCLAYGLLEEHGIWGGRTEDERRQMRRGAGLDALRVNRRDTPPHGTTARYSAHLRAGEQPCADCLHANRQDKHHARKSRSREVS
jgi:WhiB family transcriptional regulator, redox-sensing transcriptional regulator